MLSMVVVISLMVPLDVEEQAGPQLSIDLNVVAGALRVVAGWMVGVLGN